MNCLLKAYATVLTTSFVSYLIFHIFESAQNPASFVFLIVLVPAALSRLVFSFYNVPVAFLVASTSYWTSLAFIAIIYRISPFHPLAAYPGPILNRISRLHLYYESVRGNLYRYRQELHQRYGDIVRIGPDDISYSDVDGVQPVLGTNGLPKGPLFYSGKEQPSIFHIQDPGDYGPRRRLWNKAFSSTSLKHYEDNVVKRTRELVDQLGKHKLKPVDISKWMEFFAFDVMGDIAFNTSFDLMKAGKDERRCRKKLMDSVQLHYYVSQSLWLNKFVRIFINPDHALRKLAEGMVGERLKAGSKAEDIFYHLSQDDDEDRNDINEALLIEEGILAIVAGSDTTSTAMANLWYFLLRNPSYYTRLRQEVDEVFPSGEDPIDQQKLASMRYLNACIHESIRLFPPVPSGSQRIVPIGSGGRMVGSHYIPEGTIITVHPYAIHRDSRYFSPYPTGFWPDRWLPSEDRKSLHDITKPLDKDVEVVTDPMAFIPFSAGTRNCPGKNFAMIEMRIVASYIVQRFDMQVAEGYDLNNWEGDLGDFFIIKKGALPVVLTERV